VLLARGGLHASGVEHFLCVLSNETLIADRLGLFLWLLVITASTTTVHFGCTGKGRGGITGGNRCEGI